MARTVMFALSIDNALASNAWPLNRICVTKLYKIEYML